MEATLESAAKMQLAWAKVAEAPAPHIFVLSCSEVSPPSKPNAIFAVDALYSRTLEELTRHETDLMLAVKKRSGISAVLVSRATWKGIQSHALFHPGHSAWHFGDA